MGREASPPLAGGTEMFPELPKLELMGRGRETKS